MFELGTDGPSRILVGVDGSDTSMRAGAYAAGLARRQGARLISVYVKQISGLIAAVPSAVSAAVALNDTVAAELRAQIEENAPRLGIDVTFIERSGDPYHELVRVADELRVDAVVVGASTQSGHRFVGSLALRLVKDARWPVTVVP